MMERVVAALKNLALGKRVYPKSKRCIYCPLEKKPCAIDDLCPCPWRGAKFEIATFVRSFEYKPPLVIRKRNVFNLD
eukprot:765736-Hanusia_phi.AAC.5